jgi:hypothetical protein
MGCKLHCFRLARWEALGRIQASLRAQRSAASADRMAPRLYRFSIAYPEIDVRVLVDQQR